MSEFKTSKKSLGKLESRINIEVSTWNSCQSFDVDSPFIIDKISSNFRREISMSNPWRIAKDVSIGNLLLVWKTTRGSHRRCSKSVLKDFVNFTGKHLCWSLFSIKLKSWRPAALLKLDFNTVIFLWHLRQF